MVTCAHAARLPPRARQSAYARLHACLRQTPGSAFERTVRGFADQHAYVAAAIAALADLPLRAEVDAAVQASEPEAYGGAPAVTTPIEVRRSAGGRSESSESCVYVFTHLNVNIHLNQRARSRAVGQAWADVAAHAVFAIGGWRLRFDPSTGAIDMLQDRAGAEHRYGYLCV